MQKNNKSRPQKQERLARIYIIRYVSIVAFRAGRFALPRSRN